MPNPTLELATTLILSADDGWDGEVGDAVGTTSAGGGSVGASTVIGDGLLATGDFAGEILGAIFGDGAEDLGDGDETGETLGAFFGDGAETGDLAGEMAGATIGGGTVASVLTSSFIPEAQCPPVPQMKYLLPVEDRDMTVIPPPFVDIAFVVWHES